MSAVSYIDDPYIVVSSALRIVDTLFIYKTNDKGPITKPCGTPMLTVE